MGQTKLKLLSNWLKSSTKTAILTGAGMSTECGVPDFRSSTGIWKKFNPHQVATVKALESNYSLFHEFYSLRINMIEQCKPHAGHFILAKWEKKGYIHCLATQNVDGFHLAAGSENIEELHGSIHQIRCQSCSQPASKEAFLNKENCTFCGGHLRPNVVLFGESLPALSWASALQNIKEATLVIVIGTSLEVYPVNQLPTMTNGKTVYINKDLSHQHGYFHLTIEGKAKETLQQINQLLND